MNRLNFLIKQEVRTHGHYDTLRRIRAGKILTAIAALPLFTSPLFIVSLPMLLPVSFPMWVKDKINFWKIGRMLR